MYSAVQFTIIRIFNHEKIGRLCHSYYFLQKSHGTYVYETKLGIYGWCVQFLHITSELRASRTRSMLY